MQKDREVEDREALDQGERDPDQRVVKTDERPRGQPENAELTPRHEEVPPPGFPVEFPQLVAGDGCGELSPQRHSMLRIVMGFHQNLLKL
jgi:hypothetical protein